MSEIRPGIPIGYEPHGLALDIGAGTAPIPGFTHVDVRPLPHMEVVVDILKEPLPYRDGEVDMIYSSHFLEHVPFRSVEQVLADWVRVLKPRGTLEIHVPDMGAMSQRVLDGTIGFEDLMLNMFGGQFHPWDFHISGFDYRLLAELLGARGMKVEQLGNRIDPLDLSVGAVKL